MLLRYTNRQGVAVTLARTCLIIQVHCPELTTDDQQHILERLEGGPNTTEGEPGIGLWPASRFREEKGWSFYFDSDELSGSRVTIQI